MEPILSYPVVISLILGYFLLLLVISRWSAGRGDNESFFNAKRSSPWLLVAIGMIGASLSGVTFISLPGAVGRTGANEQYSYMQMVLGYLIGYVIIAQVLLPIYYRYQLTSIYTFLGQRLNTTAHKTGSAFFLISRTLGASFRLFLVAMVLQVMLMDPLGVPFAVTVLVTIGLIWVYTFQGGIKTIVVTDTLQTIFMLAAVVITIVSIMQAMDISIGELPNSIRQANLGQMFYFEDGWSNPNQFIKQVISGALITIVMTGLDQDMMQKNLTCRSLSDAQKNMYTFSIILVVANLLFITMGALLYMYADHLQVTPPERGDQLYPMLAMYHLPSVVGGLFLIGLLAAAYSSADSALTSLTTAFCIDFLDFETKTDRSEQKKKRIRWQVHLAFSFLLATIIILVEQLSSGSILNDLFTAATYTYGPILGLFAYAMTLRRQVSTWAIILVCVAAPVLCYVINANAVNWFNGFNPGYLILLFNGVITFSGLYLASLVRWK